MRSFLLICCFIYLPATEFVLLQQVELHKEMLLVGDVLSAEQADKLPEAAKDLSVQRITSSVATTISAARILQVLRKHKLWDASDSISGKSNVVRGKTLIKSTELSTAVEVDLRNRLQDEFKASKVNVAIQRKPNTVSILSDIHAAHQLLVEPIDKTRIGRVPYRVRVMRGRFELARQLVVMDVEMYYPSLAAVRALPRGHVLGELDVITKDVRVAHARDLATTQQFADVLGKVLKQDLKAGQVIKDNYLREAYAVQGGHAVDIVYEHAEFTITMRGKAHGNATIGQEVRVESLSNGQQLRGKVIGPGRVAVE